MFLPRYTFNFCYCSAPADWTGVNFVRINLWVKNYAYFNLNSWLFIARLIKTFDKESIESKSNLIEIHMYFKPFYFNEFDNHSRKFCFLSDMKKSITKLTSWCHMSLILCETELRTRLRAEKLVLPYYIEDVISTTFSFHC